MSAEHGHVAHPRLYGAPAYARPRSVEPTTLPLHPDDLPIAAEQTAQERAIAELAMANKYGVPEPAPRAVKPEPAAPPHALRLGAIADKLLRHAS
jgi:hypothetical protein